MDYQLLLTKLINSDFYLPTVLIAGYITGVFALPLAALVWEGLTNLSRKARNLFASTSGMFVKRREEPTPLVNVVEVHLHLSDRKADESDSLDRTDADTQVPPVEEVHQEPESSAIEPTKQDEAVQVESSCSLFPVSVETVEEDAHLDEVSLEELFAEQLNETEVEFESDAESHSTPTFAPNPEIKKPRSIEELLSERAARLQSAGLSESDKKALNPSYVGLMRFLESRKAVRRDTAPVESDTQEKLLPGFNN